MYGAAGKHGRGGGGGGGSGRGGGGKRNNHSGFAPPPLHRSTSAAAPIGRLSLGGAGVVPRNQPVSAPASAPASSSAAEETFKLVTGNPLNFAMVIRLVPDLVEQIKKVEAQGGRARIKFDANPNNPTGNVINVGDKDFKFIWSPETGELCDIYEERRSGEDGNGLLVESGSAWRKLNVQRVLDESTTNHVKMRSEEAERKLKSRKAIVLDHGNPSMKNQMKALVAAESNPYRMPFKPKKEQPPFKKRKTDPPTGGPPKAVQKYVSTMPTPLKGRPLASPPSSPRDQLGVPVSPIGIGNLSKAHANIEDINSSQFMNKIISSEKDTAVKVSPVVQEKMGGKAFKRAQPTDLRSMLIALLMDNPSKGMSLMALEKAVGVKLPNSGKQIEPILKKIATFQAPGRYFLKPGAEIESFKNPVCDGQSSPEGNRHQSPIHENFDQQPDQQSSIMMNKKELEDQAPLTSKSDGPTDSQEKVNVPPNSEDLFGEKKVIDNSEGPVGSSSDSGSDTDSESDSSDSGSDSGSHSRSRSRSPAGSGSGSSSDSESDASTNSKEEASDVNVDIMSCGDDKEAKLGLQSIGLGLPRSEINGESDQIEIDEKHDEHVSDVFEDVHEEECVGEVAAHSDSVPNEEGKRHVAEIEPSSHTFHEHLEKHDYLGKINSEPDLLSKSVFKHEQSNSSEKVPKGKNKRVSDGKHFEDTPEHSKRLKFGNSNHQQVMGSRTSAAADNHQKSSPDFPFEDPGRGLNSQMTNKIARDVNTGFGSQRGFTQANSGRSKADSQQASSLVDANARTKTALTTERQGKHQENAGRSVKPPERSFKMAGAFPMQKDKFSREAQDDHVVSNYKVPEKFPKEDFGEKHSNLVNPHHKKHEMKEFEPVSNSLNSPKDESRNISNRTIGNGRAKVLQREYSDLESGEFRESFPEETLGFLKQIEQRSSFKKLEHPPLMSENLDSDLGKGKPPGKTIVGTSRPFPLDSNTSFSGGQESMSKRGQGDHHAEDLSRPHQRVSQLQNRQHHPSRTDHNDSGNQYNRLTESSGRNRVGDSSRSLEAAPEVRGNTLNKISVSAPQEHEAKRGVIPPSRKESDRQKSNSILDLNDKQKDASLTGSSDGGQRRRESSSDENSCPYSKYDKNEPEVKGPVKDSTQFKLYVEEFQEKYDAYQSIFNILESYREEFMKYTKEYEASKGRDAEKCKEVVRQIKESYHQNVERHKRLKRISLLLHEELKTLKKMITDFAEPYVKNNE